MRTFGKWLGRMLLILIALGAAFWFFAPREPVDLETSFDDSALGEDLDTYLAAAEAGVPNLKPDVAKRIIWAGAPGEKTPLSVVYLHGFSATSEEIRPVPDKVAEGLGANLYFARLKGHGRDGDAMSEPTAGDWMEDTAEALAIGRRLGERVIVIATSTGGSLAALAARDEALARDIAGIVFVSPNFRLQNPMAPLLTWPAARHYLPLIAGERRSFEAQNNGHAAFWTTEYPSVAVFPMAALVKASRQADYSGVTIPALFISSPDDQVISPQAVAKVRAGWGGPAQALDVTMAEGDDRDAHVIMGAILSPNQTEAGVERILAWVAGLP